MRILILLGTLLALGAQDYYVSPDGDDANTGTSTTQPWRTVGMVNARAFAAGDRIFFQGGRSFSDAGLRLRSDDQGTPQQPIILRSYGSGRATIRAASDQAGIDIYNTAGIEIHDLIFIGSGIASSSKPGLKAYCDLPGGARLPHLRVVDCEFSAFYQGIEIGAWEASFSGFDDLLIERCLVHTIRHNGIETWGYWSNSDQPPMSHRRITIRDCEVFGATGDPARTSSHSGSGIIVSGVSEALIDRCYAHHNGGSAGTIGGGGPVGIWTWHSDRVVIQRCLVHDQKTTQGVKDGGGFDIDGGARNTTIQYCYSYNNEGPGYLIAAFRDTAALTNGVIRYNISWRDARRVDNGHGSGIHFWSDGSNPASDCSDIRIYNNTIYADGSSGGPLIRFQSGAMTGHYLANNILVVSGGQRFVEIPGNLAAFTFHNNAYHAVDGNYSGGWRWDASSYTSLASWRSASQNPETHNGQDLGFQLDPRVESIVNGAQPVSIAEMEAMPAFRLHQDSPLIDAGLDLRSSTFGSLDVGTRDLFGTTIPAGAGFDLGAHARSKPSAMTPAAPSDLTASASSSSTVALTWTDHSSTETGFRIERALGSGSFALVTTVAADATSHTDQGLNPDTAYSYRLRALHPDGDSTWSAIVSVTTPAETPPVGTNLVANGDFEIDLGGSQIPSAWSTWAGAAMQHDADFTESYGGSVSGDHHLTHYRGESGSWSVYTYQVIDGIPDGHYTLTAWARKSGVGFTACRMEVKNHGGNKRTVDIPSNADYQRIELTGIEIQGGACEIAFWTQVDGGSNWPYAYIDLVSLVASGSTTTEPPTEVLPAGWQAADIGVVAAAGSVVEDAGQWTITGSGGDIWNQQDGFHFVHQPLSGDVVLSVRVDSIDRTHDWAKAGLMIRERSAAGSRHAFTCLTPGNGVAFQRRTETNSTSAHTAGPLVTAPYWLRLERSGSTLIGSCSSNGQDWQEIRRISIALPEQVQVGLAVTSHADGVTCTARFSEFTVLPSGSN